MNSHILLIFRKEKPLRRHSVLSYVIQKKQKNGRKNTVSTKWKICLLKLNKRFVCYRNSFFLFLFLHLITGFVTRVACGTCHFTLVTNLVIRHERVKDQIVIMTNGTHLWSKYVYIIVVNTKILFLSDLIRLNSKNELLLIFLAVHIKFEVVN